MRGRSALQVPSEELGERMRGRTGLSPILDAKIINAAAEPLFQDAVREAGGPGVLVAAVVAVRVVKIQRVRGAWLVEPCPVLLCKDARRHGVEQEVVRRNGSPLAVPPGPVSPLELIVSAPGHEACVVRQAPCLVSRLLPYQQQIVFQVSSPQDQAWQEYRRNRSCPSLL